MKLGRTTAALLLAVPVPLALAPAAHAAAIRCHGELATIVGGVANDTLFGTSGSDVIAGRGGKDQIHGGGGDDVICGGPHADVIDGGAGDDILNGNRGKDQLSDGEGDDRVSGGRGLTTKFFPGGGDDLLDAGSTAPTFEFGAAPGPVTVDLVAGTATGWGSDTIHVAAGTGATIQGSPFGDTLLGTPAADTLVGEGGVDTLDGRGGVDRVIAQDGDLSGGDGADTVVLFHAGTMDGGAGADLLVASGEAFGVAGGAGDDRTEITTVVTGAPLPDLFGGEGHDLLQLFVRLPVPWVPFVYDLGSGSLGYGDYSTTAPGFEDLLLSGDASSFDITGTEGPNHIELFASNLAAATLRGLGGDDDLVGSGGDDTIDGGPGGADVADGRDGSDSCTGVESPTSCETVAP